MSKYMYALVNDDGTFVVVKVPWRLDNRANVIPATDPLAFTEPSMYEIKDGLLVRKSTESEVIADGY